MDNVKEMITGYESENGHNPFDGAIGIITIGKSIPLSIVKSMGVALVITIGYNLLSFSFLDSFLLTIPFLITSILGMAYLIFVGFYYFFMNGLIENLRNIIIGTLEPINKVYETYTNTKNLRITKKKFFLGVLKEEIIPKLIDNVFLRRFEGRVTKLFSNVIENMESNKENISYEGDGDNNMDGIINKFNDAFDRAEYLANKPFYMALKIWGVFVGVTILITLF